MTLLFIDGFDVGDAAIKWYPYSAIVTNTPASSTNTPWSAGRSLKINAPEALELKRPIPPTVVVVVGTQFQWPGAEISETRIQLFKLWTDTGAHLQLTLGIDIFGTVQLWLGDVGDTLLASGPASQITPGVWFFIEMKATIADSGGVGIVRVNEAEIINFSGDTRASGTSTNVDVVSFGALGQQNAYWDDFYIADTGGSINNDFFGIGRVQTLLPSAAGTDTMLTPIPGAPNYDNVNDVPWSSTDYNYSDTAGDRDLYQLDDLASSSVSVRGVQTVLIADSDDTTSSVKAVLRSAGTDYSDPTVVLNAAPSVVSLALRENDPATSAAWTVSAVNALQAGMEIVT